MPSYLQIHMRQTLWWVKENLYMTLAGTRTCLLQVHLHDMILYSNLYYNFWKNWLIYWWFDILDPDLCVFATSTRDHPIHLWDANSGQVLSSSGYRRLHVCLSSIRNLSAWYSLMLLVVLHAYSNNYGWNGNFSCAAHIVPMTPWMRLLLPFQLASILMETSKHLYDFLVHSRQLIHV